MQHHDLAVTAPAAGQEPFAISLVVPLMNEEDNVGPLIDRIVVAMTDVAGPWELILIDDGSTDATLARAREHIGREGLTLSIIEFQRNFGQTAAMQAGIDAARGRLIATMDGDLQNDPKDIAAMVAELERRELDLLVGWRKDRQDGFFLRRLPSLIANRLIGRITGVRLHDYGCSMKIYRASVIKQVQLMGEMHRFIPAWVASVAPNYRIGETVVTHHARRFGQSKYGISRTIRVILDLIAIAFFMRFRQRPGHFFGAIGLLLGAVSSVILLYLAYVKIVLGEDIGTRPLLLIGFMLLLASVQMLTTGILAEMLARTAERPQSYLVRAVHGDHG